MRLGSFMTRGHVWRERLDSLCRRFPEHEIIVDPEASKAALPGLDAILASRIGRDFYEAATSLKVVFVPFTGLNHLPVDLLLERGVRVYNVHGNSDAVAERALAMTLAFLGRLIEFHQDLRSCRWHGAWVGRGREDVWTSLYGRRCAILGSGAIGVSLARLLKVFDCRVTGYRRRAGEALPPNFDSAGTDLAAAIGDAEIVFIALPLTPATTGLVTKEMLLSMKGKVLVNVGRGPIVDEEGLYLALRDGVLKGAAIDTWYTYPQNGSTEGAPSRFPIHELPNVVLSPHVAGSSEEAYLISADETIENLSEWFSTGSCSREVNLREMY